MANRRSDRVLNGMAIRILHVIPTLGRGGAERQLVDLVSNTDSSRYEHVVCHLQLPDAFAADLRLAGQRVIGLQLTGKRPWMAAVRKLIPLIRAERPDVIHTWLYDANVCVRLARAAVGDVPLITSLQLADYDPETIQASRWPQMKVRGLCWLDRMTARRARPFFVACSHFVAESARKRLGVPNSRIRVIYNSVDPRTVRCGAEEPARLRQALGIPADGVVFLNVGRLDPQKGQTWLLHAFERVAARIPSAYLAIAGDGPLAPELRQLAHGLGVESRIRFLGIRTDIGACLGMADVFVFPSLFEGFGIALVEAMFQGLPCIAARVGPLPELITEGKSGLLISPGSVDHLAEAMETLGADPLLRHELGRRGQQDAAARFHTERIMPQWEELYSDLTRKVRSPEAARTESIESPVHPSSGDRRAKRVPR